MKEEDRHGLNDAEHESDELDLLESVYKDRIQVVKILDMFERTTSEDMLKLLDAIERAHIGQVKELAHKIKGSAEFLNANGIVEVAKQIESSHDIRRIKELYRELQVKYADFVEFLDGYKNKLNERD